MHQAGADSVLRDAIYKYAADRMAMDPVPLDGPKAPAELASLVGNTITEAGMGGLAALAVFVERHTASSTCRETSTGQSVPAHTEPMEQLFEAATHPAKACSSAPCNLSLITLSRKSGTGSTAKEMGRPTFWNLCRGIIACTSPFRRNCPGGQRDVPELSTASG